MGIFKSNEKPKEEKETTIKERELPSNIESLLTIVEEDLSCLEQEVHLVQQILSHLKQEREISLYNARTLNQITLIATKCQTLSASAQLITNDVFGLITIISPPKKEGK